MGRCAIAACTSTRRTTRRPGCGYARHRGAREHMTKKAGPLDGIKVLELGTMHAAPTAGRMMRDFGADGTKVEDPETGDCARQWTPGKDGLSLGFARLNAGKRSVAIDLRSTEGRDVVRRVAA